MTILTEPRALEQVLADWRGDAAVLRARGHGPTADVIERLVDDVARAAEDYTRWLSELEATLQAGHSASWLRRRYPAWAAEGHARRNVRGAREYRSLVVPHRSHASVAREAGREAGRATAVDDVAERRSARRRSA